MVCQAYTTSHFFLMFTLRLSQWCTKIKENLLFSFLGHIFESLVLGTIRSYPDWPSESRDSRLLGVEPIAWCGVSTLSPVRLHLLIPDSDQKKSLIISWKPSCPTQVERALLDQVIFLFLRNPFFFFWGFSFTLGRWFWLTSIIIPKPVLRE